MEIVYVQVFAKGLPLFSIKKRNFIIHFLFEYTNKKHIFTSRTFGIVLTNCPLYLCLFGIKRPFLFLWSQMSSRRRRPTCQHASLAFLPFLSHSSTTFISHFSLQPAAVDLLLLLPLLLCGF
jgi:hypothetical protein